MKKRLLIIGPGMELGGVERSLIGLLDAFDYNEVEVDLVLFRHTGELMKDINPNANLLPESHLLANSFKSIPELLKGGHLFTATLRGISRFIGRRNRMVRKRGDDQKDIYQHIVSRLLPKLGKEYDLALGFIDPHYYLLHNVNAKVKVGWMHTDWATIGARSGKTISPEMWAPLDFIACVSDGVKESFDKIFPDLSGKSIVVENILPQNYVRKLADEEIPESEMPCDAFNILSVGRFTPQKAFLRAIRCCKVLHDDGVKFRWYFIGFGAQEERMRALVKELGAEDYAIILGKRSNPYPYMKRCDLYAQPSTFEGKAVTVREAQMLARPVLITNYATAPSQLENGVDGHICELSKEGIVAGVKLLMEDAALREKYSRTCSERDYSGMEVVGQLMALAK